jgi:hypothetical protein
MGKWGAVRNNSGLPVHQSGPGLGRANNSTNSQPKAGGLPSNLGFNTSQPKTGRESEGGALSGSAAEIRSGAAQKGPRFGPSLTDKYFLITTLT